MLKSQNLMPSYYICVLNSQKPSEILCRQNREITSKVYSGDEEILNRFAHKRISKGWTFLPTTFS